MQEPIVCCEIGNLFNKAAIFTALLEKSLQTNPTFSYIRGRKDLQTLKLTVNPDQSKEKGSAPFMCPVTKLEMNGQVPFVIVWQTGHVLSEKAVREIGPAGLQSEFGPFDSADLVKLCPLEEEQPAQIEQMIARRAVRDGSSRGSGTKRTHSEVKASGAVALPSTTGTLTLEDGRSDTKRGKKVIATAAAGSGSLPQTATTTAAATAITTSTNNLRASASVVRSAAAAVAVAGQQNGGRVYQKLFHSEQQQGKMSDRDLFMSVAGLRYSI